jgi:hypothetical protein
VQSFRSMAHRTITGLPVWAMAFSIAAILWVCGLTRRGSARNEYNGNLALAVLAGISIGAVSVRAIHAQEAKTPRLSHRGNRGNRPRHLSDVRTEKVPETLAPFTGSFHYVVRGGKT